MNYDHEHDDDIFITGSGQEEYRPQWVVEANDTLSSEHSGGICVESGASFDIALSGRHSGSLTFRPGSAGVIAGQHSGSLHVLSGSDVVVTGVQSGSAHVYAGATLKVASSGRLAGALHVAGLIENRGQRGGTEHLDGDGQIVDLDGGSVKPPEYHNGDAYYMWSAEGSQS